jgi:hypothetical protein
MDLIESQAPWHQRWEYRGFWSSRDHVVSGLSAQKIMVIPTWREWKGVSLFEKDAILVEISERRAAFDSANTSADMTHIG